MSNPQPAAVKYLGPPVDERGRLVKYELGLGNAESLAVMTEEYTFFTPAPLYLHGLFSDGPLIDFMYERQDTVRLYYKRFDRQLFHGLEAANGDSDWNHVLWACRREQFGPLADFVVSLSMMIREENRLVRYGEQKLAIFDPLALTKQVLLSDRMLRLEITAFGVIAANFRTAFRPAPSLHTEEAFMWSHPPRLTFFAGDPGMKLFTDAAVAGDNPFDARNVQQHLEALQRHNNDDSRENRETR